MIQSCECTPRSELKFDCVWGRSYINERSINSLYRAPKTVVALSTISSIILVKSCKNTCLSNGINICFPTMINKTIEIMEIHNFKLEDFRLKRQGVPALAAKLWTANDMTVKYWVLLLLTLDIKEEKWDTKNPCFFSKFSCYLYQSKS